MLLSIDMGVKIFRNDNWERIRNGAVSRRDITGLDPVKNRELIGYLIAHAPEPSRRSMMEYAAEKYGMNEFPEPHQNIDDPDDPYYEEYFVLQEQAVLEEDCSLLKEAALHSPDHDMAAFAFCRLTGYSFPPDDCDAYSYRTFGCDILPGMTTEDIREFCRIMIGEKGSFATAAGECLRNL